MEKIESSFLHRMSPASTDVSTEVTVVGKSGFRKRCPMHMRAYATVVVCYHRIMIVANYIATSNTTDLYMLFHTHT